MKIPFIARLKFTTNFPGVLKATEREEADERFAVSPALLSMTTTSVRKGPGAGRMPENVLE